MKIRLKVLLIEDDRIERMKFQKAVNTLGYQVSIQEANNGEDALNQLNNIQNLPNLILLDLNMPRVNGKEFLIKLKSLDQLAFVPIVVLTTSNNANDVHDCFKIGVGGYILKPLKYEDYLNSIDKILAYWSHNNLVKS